MAFTTNTANAILNAILNNTAMTLPSSLYVSLHTAEPGENGANELVGTTRQIVDFNTASTKATTNSIDVIFETMPAATITHIGLWNAQSNGTFWWGGALIENKTTASGDTFKISSGNLDVTLT